MAEVRIQIPASSDGTRLQARGREHQQSANTKIAHGRSLFSKCDFRPVALYRILWARSHSQRFFGKSGRSIEKLGMHRSGTSALGGVINALGAAGPKTPLPSHAANPRVFFESAPLALAHGELLALAGSSWLD